MRPLLVLLLALPLAAQTVAKPSATKPTAKMPAKAAPARAPMVAGAAQQVAMQESRVRDALLTSDVDGLDKLVAAEFVGTRPDGEVVSKKQVIATLSSGEVRYFNVALFDMRVHLFGPTVGVVTGRVDASGKSKDGDFAAAYRYTHVWQKQGAAWKLIAAQSTALPAPQPK